MILDDANNFRIRNFFPDIHYYIVWKLAYSALNLNVTMHKLISQHTLVHF